MRKNVLKTMVVAMAIMIGVTFASFGSTNDGGQGSDFDFDNTVETEAPEPEEPEETEPEEPSEPEETEPEEPEIPEETEPEEPETPEETEPEETEPEEPETPEETEPEEPETPEETEPETEAPTEPETEAPTEPETEAPEENDDDDDDDDDGPHRTWRPEDLHTGPGVETEPEVVVIEEQPNYDVPETTPVVVPEKPIPEKPNRDLPKTADTTHNVPVCAVAVLVIVGGGAILIANRRKNG